MSSGQGRDDETAALPLLNGDDEAPTAGQQQRRQRPKRLVLLAALSLATLTLLGPLVAVFLGEMRKREALEAPCPRKGGVALVLGGGGGFGGGGGGGGFGGSFGGGNGNGDDGKNSSSSPSFSTPRLVVWSGKKRGKLSGDADGELNGAVHVLDLDLDDDGGGGSGGRSKKTWGKGGRGKWRVVRAAAPTADSTSTSTSGSPSSSSLPLPRWKPVAAPLSPSRGALFGGDAQLVEAGDGEGEEVEDSYLNDFWNLELLEGDGDDSQREFSLPSSSPLSVRWTRVPSVSSSSSSSSPSPSSSVAAAVPQARRAALGVSLPPSDDGDDDGEEEEEGEEEEGGAAARGNRQRRPRRRRRRSSPTTLLVHGGRGLHKSEGLLSDLWAATEEGRDGQEGRWERLWPPSDSGVAAASSSSSDGDDDAPLPRKGHAGVALPRGASSPLFSGPALFLTGGRNDSSAECYHGDTFLFDVEGRKWHRVPFAAAAASSSSSSPSSSHPSLLRRDHAGAWLCDEQGTVFVFGGRGGDSHEASKALGDLLAFDVKSKRWATVSPSPPSSSSSLWPAPRFLFGVGSYRSRDGDTRAVVFGGEGAGGAYFNDAWEFGCREKKWRALTRGAAAAG